MKLLKSIPVSWRVINLLLHVLTDCACEGRQGAYSRGIKGLVKLKGIPSSALCERRLLINERINSRKQLLGRTCKPLN